MINKVDNTFREAIESINKKIGEEKTKVNKDTYRIMKLEEMKLMPNLFNDMTSSSLLPPKYRQPW